MMMRCSQLVLVFVVAMAWTAVLNGYQQAEAGNLRYRTAVVTPVAPAPVAPSCGCGSVSTCCPAPCPACAHGYMPYSTVVPYVRWSNRDGLYYTGHTIGIRTKLHARPW